MSALDRLEKHWRWWLLALWLIVAGWSIYARWAAIQGFGLGDTDDNMRMMQVRAWLDGQGWYDLRQYRLNPPVGADIHWSRLVDLPIAGLKLLFTPLLGGGRAEQLAVAVAPVLPMGVAMAAMAITVRRLVDSRAFLLGVLLLACAGSARGMWTPLRIDHHGWQLAMVALAVMALTDPKRTRGGVILGLATAASLVIGLEMLLYLALAGIVTVLRWIWDGDEAKGLAAYGASLAGGSAFGFLAFASYANRAPVCDALSPVWLSAMMGAGAIAVLLAWTNPSARHWRLAAAALGGITIAGFFALAWPGCLGRLEQAPPELDRLWLSRVREAMPIYRHGFETAAAVLTLPVAGFLGYALMLWTHRRDPARLIPWAAIAVPAILALALLFWQTRAGPAAQLLSIPGATALAWAAILWIWGLKSIALRAVAIFVVFLIISGTATGYLNRLFPNEVTAYRRSVNSANATCPSLRALRPVAQQPKGTVLTFVDLGPRLITVTHHDALAGPYHRNAHQILDVMHAWRGTPENAHATIRRYRVGYVLICPNMSESTIYRSEAPQGFYSQLARGKVPTWLQPVRMPTDSPYRMWRVIS
jgi:hypothetical protein